MQLAAQALRIHRADLRRELAWQPHVVGVEKRDKGACRVGDPGVARRRGAAIAVVANKADIVQHQRFGRAVIHHNNFDRPIRRQRLRTNARNRHTGRARPIVGRYDN